ncbi:hypothetical protein KM043_014981 [Ampulex compressa]|nr:hypothetical protein KM043_014981 [Ampulex compressa]
MAPESKAGPERTSWPGWRPVCQVGQRGELWHPRPRRQITPYTAIVQIPKGTTPRSVRRVGTYLGVKDRPEISFSGFFKSSHEWTSLSRAAHLLC